MQGGKIVKILFVNTHMITGGIATSLVNLCNQLKDIKDIEIDILLLEDTNSDKRYDFGENVRIINVNSKEYDLYITKLNDTLKNKEFIKMLQLVKFKIIRKILGPEQTMERIVKKVGKLGAYDVAISFRNDEFQYTPYSILGCNDFVLECIDSPKKIAWIHNDPDKHGYTHEISKRRFEKFDAIVNVSQGCKNRFDEIIPEYKEKSKVVYNTFNYDEIRKRSKEYNPYQNVDSSLIKFVTVGRILNEQKRMDRIVEVCNKLKQKEINNYIWYIVGDGKDKSELEIKVKELGLSDKIIFVGKQSNPFTYMRYADCLVMTSEYESYGMTLIEALTTNTPVITTNHLAAKEIVKENINGFITDNSSDSIEERIRDVLQNPQVLKQLKENIKNHEIDEKLALNQFLELIEYKKKD